jgi:hypothetical protein
MMAERPTSSVEEVVLRALQRLEAEDAHLFDVGVSERSLTFRLGLYLQEAFGNDWRVDCEYNRNGRSPKRLDAIKQERLAINPDSKSEGDVFPDIIVHHRDEPGPNLLVIEAKKASEQTQESVAFDYLKLRAYRDELGYRSTAFIVFGIDANHPSCTVDFDPERR